MRFLKWINHPLTRFLLFGAIVLSFPIWPYPLTDGDISNWAHVAQAVHVHGSFFGIASDQGHGPLIAWGSAPFLFFAPMSFFALNFFNLLCGLLGVGLMYYFSKRLFQQEGAARLSTYFLATSLVFVYLSRTPMYDWPATVMYFAFTGFYALYLRENKSKDLWISLVAIALGSLSRFSICGGLAVIFIFFTTLIYRRKWWLMVRDMALVSVCILLANLPWFLNQFQMYGMPFLQTFLYDNTGRFVKSTRPHAVYRGDFYGFSLYVLIGILPHTFFLIASFFNRAFVQKVKEMTLYQVLLASFLPCLILFSISGHTKLGRYIAYVFPGLLLLLGHYVYAFGLTDATFRKKCARMTVYTSGFLAVILGVLLIQFSQEAQQSVNFVLGVFVLLFSLLWMTYFTVKYRHVQLREQADTLLLGYAIGYMLFFAMLAYESERAPFLTKVHKSITKSLMKPYAETASPNISQP
jgi:4-amino-4-deoxy-L-arabinose transferase-like glycosyltransferase